MPPSFEIMVVLIVTVSMITMGVITKLVLDYLRDKNRAHEGSGASLTSGELERLMQSAVENALRTTLAPLQARIESLESEVAASSTARPLLGEALGEEVAEPEDQPSRAAMRRRVPGS